MPERPFVDTPVGDIDRARLVAGHAAAHWGLGDAVLQRVGMNAVFVADDTVVRVGRPTAPATVALDLADHLAAIGVRVPAARRRDVVAVDDLVATAWELLVPAGTQVDWTAVGEMVARLHRAGTSVVPAGHPCPSPVAFPWWSFDAMLADVADVLDTEASEALSCVIERHRSWIPMLTSGPVVCHGDVHPGNVVQTADGPVLLDWDLLCRAPAGWDHAPMMRWAERWGGASGEYEAFAAGYGWSGRGDPFAEAVADLRLVAATLMRVRVGRTEPAARREAERRLRTWRGDPDAPAWSAQ
jgi:Ser/Thr protein kinase RdoA (MazF antagonist)